MNRQFKARPPELGVMPEYFLVKKCRIGPEMQESVRIGPRIGHESGESADFLLFESDFINGIGSPRNSG